MRLLLFGPGYTGTRIAAAFATDGAAVTTIGRNEDASALIGAATHILSTVPPGEAGDPILNLYGPALAEASAWKGYLSSTGVYGDCGGAWVDESAPVQGRRSPRNAADAAWNAIGACVFRLPGIYGPGRSILDRIAAGAAHRIDLPGQVFSRIHVEDIVSAVQLAARAGSHATFNLGDDAPAPQNALVELGCALLGRPLPPLQGLQEAALSPAARAFYAENRRIANVKAKRLLGWRPRYPDYRAGLRALIATTSPAITSTPPNTASTDQR
ncbi:nucleoside-diphosphate-sugar epimerase [Sphingomonas vulcanisoli]|uniref:Nucleoside-diphosphate-sugar epimerase n=1 Tax=Sphingomonas vulcanisoli TaxID=1658060 RepID=A0ABX0TW42_9SPHN|nr:nucleoside-diphosphate-sugar epimerase [Sphingomonas vulcanisoli]